MKRSPVRRRAAAVANSLIKMMPGIRVFARSGSFGVYVRINDPAIGAKVLIRGSHEPELTKVLGRLLSPGATFVDVGANIGYHSLFACSVVGPEGSVVAVEPGPDNIELIGASAKRNGFDNLTLHGVAVADKPRRVGFQEEYGSNRQIDLNGSGAGIEASTLDVLLAGEERIDVLKIDIEGAEGLAMSAADETIRRCRPVIVTEFFPDLLAKVSRIEPSAYLDLLRGYGYTLHLDDESAAVTNEDIFADLAASPYRHLDLVARPA